MPDDFPNDWSKETDYITAKEPAGSHRVSGPKIHVGAALDTPSEPQEDGTLATGKDDLSAHSRDANMRLSEARGEVAARSTDDPIALGDWIKEAQGVETMTYEPKTDCLLLVWDDGSLGAVEPDVSVVADFIDPDIVHVFMNGIPVAEVNGDPDLTVADVTLVPLSVAGLVGLSPS